MAERKSPLRSIGILFPILIAIGLIAITVGTRLCGNVEHGKDVRVALETGDTVRSDALPRNTDGSPAYAFECIRERNPGDYGWPYVILGLGIVGTVLVLLGKDWFDRRKVTS